MRIIDADEFEKRIKPYDTSDPMDKALYNFAHNMMISCTSTVDVPEKNVGKWTSSRNGNLADVPFADIMTRDRICTTFPSLSFAVGADMI